jgi:Uma2 family endonuclease
LLVHVAIQPARPVSDEEIVELSRRNPTLRFERSPQGALIVAPLTGGMSGLRNSELTHQLHAWNKRCRLGYVFDSSTAFALPTGALYAPDAAWIAREPWDALTPAQREQYVPLCPEAVFELRSKNDKRVRLLRKLGHYIDAGARLAVLVDPYQGAVHALFAGSHAVHAFDVSEEVRFVAPGGEDVLTGFGLDVRAVFGVGRPC